MMMPMIRSDDGFVMAVNHVVISRKIGLTLIWANSHIIYDDFLTHKSLGLLLLQSPNKYHHHHHEEHSAHLDLKKFILQLII